MRGCFWAAFFPWIEIHGYRQLPLRGRASWYVSRGSPMATDSHSFATLALPGKLAVTFPMNRMLL
jgi:hypothetical protein